MHTSEQLIRLSNNSGLAFETLSIFINISMFAPTKCHCQYSLEIAYSDHFYLSLIMNMLNKLVYIQSFFLIERMQKSRYRLNMPANERK